MNLKNFENLILVWAEEFDLTQNLKVENEVKTEHKVKRLNTIKGKPFGLSVSI